MSEVPEKETREYALADALSRPNAMSGLYTKLKFPLEYKDLNKKDPIFIGHVIDHADKIIKEAMDSGKDLDDPKVQQEIQAAFYGGAAGVSLAIYSDRFLRFLGIRK